MFAFLHSCDLEPRSRSNGLEIEELNSISQHTEFEENRFIVNVRVHANLQVFRRSYFPCFTGFTKKQYHDVLFKLFQYHTKFLPHEKMKLRGFALR